MVATIGAKGKKKKRQEQRRTRGEKELAGRKRLHCRKQEGAKMEKKKTK